MITTTTRAASTAFREARFLVFLSGGAPGTGHSAERKAVTCHETFLYEKAFRVAVNHSMLSCGPLDND
jgi:hypothetical protein